MADLYDVLCGTGLPVTYGRWPPGCVPDPPYIVYAQDEQRIFWADGAPYFGTGWHSIELYTREKHEETESLVEEALTAAGIGYDVYEDYIDDTNMYRVTYEVEVNRVVDE